MQGSTERQTSSSTSVKVIEEVAATIGVDPTALSQPLDDVVDPDALDALFDERSSGGHRLDNYTTFVYHGCRVTVSSDGHVSAEVVED